jgi:hypothetical protein
MDDIGFSLMGFLILMIIFYIWGLYLIYKTPQKYKKYWLFVAPLLILDPILLFVLSPFFTKTKDKAARFRGLVFFCFNTVGFWIFLIFFKYGMQAAFDREISLFSSCLSSLLYLVCVNIICKTKNM